jgi:hypothetical protein
MLVAAIILLVPYFGWGIYTLRHRYRWHEEMPLSIELATLIAVTLFIGFQVSILQDAARENRVFFIFAVLGLVTSSAALYGHVAISVLSRLIVDFVAPSESVSADKPRFGPAEALERAGDYNGAIQEYLVLARLFPKHPAVYEHLAEAELKANHPESAIAYFHRALALHKQPAAAFAMVMRLADTYARNLNNADAAREVLASFIAEHPRSPEAEQAKARLERLEAPELPVGETKLTALAVQPLEEAAAANEPLSETKEEAPIPRRDTRSAIRRRSRGTQPDRGQEPTALIEPLQQGPIRTKEEADSTKKASSEAETRNSPKQATLEIEPLATAPISTEKTGLGETAKNS